MNTTPNHPAMSRRSPRAINRRWNMYELLIEELRHLHKVWSDNFRVLMTFNSILLPGSFAVFAVILQSRTKPDSSIPQLLPLAISILSTVGIVTSALMMRAIQTVRVITALRQAEVRELEKMMSRELPVHPFLEGFALLQGSRQVPGAALSKPPSSHPYMPHGQLSYNLITLSFILAYVLLAGASIILSN